MTQNSLKDKHHIVHLFINTYRQSHLSFKTLAKYFFLLCMMIGKSANVDCIYHKFAFKQYICLNFLMLLMHFYMPVVNSFCLHTIFWSDDSKNMIIFALKGLGIFFI